MQHKVAFTVVDECILRSGSYMYISLCPDVCLYSDATCRGVCTGDDDYEDPDKDLRKDGVVEYLYFLPPHASFFSLRYIYSSLLPIRGHKLLFSKLSRMFWTINVFILCSLCACICAFSHALYGN